MSRISGIISSVCHEVNDSFARALVALLEGGYAVELDTGIGTKRYVGVETGFFGENGMIEIVSPELEPGDRVVIP